MLNFSSPLSSLLPSAGSSRAVAMTMAMMENSMCMILCVTIQRPDPFALNAGICNFFMLPAHNENFAQNQQTKRRTTTTKTTTREAHKTQRKICTEKKERKKYIGYWGNARVGNHGVLFSFFWQNPDRSVRAVWAWVGLPVASILYVNWMVDGNETMLPMGMYNFLQSGSGMRGRQQTMCIVWAF